MGLEKRSKDVKNRISKGELMCPHPQCKHDIPAGAQEEPDTEGYSEEDDGATAGVLLKSLWLRSALKQKGRVSKRSLGP